MIPKIDLEITEEKIDSKVGPTLKQGYVAFGNIIAKIEIQEDASFSEMPFT